MDAYGSEVALFKQPPVETAVKDSYVSLAKTRLKVSVKITKEDGLPAIVNPENKDRKTVAFVNLALHSLFRQVDISLNNKTITTSVSSYYPYKARSIDEFLTGRVCEQKKLIMEGVKICLKMIQSDNVFPLICPEMSSTKWSLRMYDYCIFEWDNEVFGVTESEACKMDPQQKLAIEVSYKAIENAGITLEQIKQTNTAVYMSQMNLDYSLLSAMGITKWEFQDFLGTANSMLANKISYQFDLRGPSVTMDTGCSGALVTSHMGIQSIISGESDMALCGGVNFMLGPGAFITLSKVNMISPTGQCKAFSEYADGFVRGEGCGVLLVKNLKKAIADNNHIWGVIKTTLSSDGRAESPITKPSKDQQKILIETALKNSRVDPKDIQYVECHGTGTQSGDPVEAYCVGTTIGKAKKEAKLPKIPIGSVKTNIGHLESAAASASLIKTLLMLNYGKLVPSLFSEVLNSKIDFNDLHINVNSELCNVLQFKDTDNLRLMAVISNGFGGTAGCALLQQNIPLDYKEKAIENSENIWLPLVFSAVNHAGLKDSILDTLEGIGKGYISSFKQLAYTSALQRTNYSFRHVAWERNLGDVKDSLELALAENSIGKKSHAKINTIFVFGGMGSHWENMGKELYETENMFRHTFDNLHILMKEQSRDIDLIGCLMGKYDLSEPLHGQTITFAVQIALSEMLKNRGIFPDTVIGHSVGEIAAAYVGGYLPLQDAILIICQRAVALQKVEGGSMLAISDIPPSEVLEILKYNDIDIEIAAYNSSMSCTLSGEEESIDKIIHLLRQQKGDNFFMRKMNVKVAYHSKYMDPVLGMFQASISSLTEKKSTYNINKCQLISTVTGLNMSSENCHSPGYWSRNLRQSVNFHKAFKTTLSQSYHNVIVEIGPKPVLRSYIKSIACDYDYSLYASMMKDSNLLHFYKVVSSLFQDGIKVKWNTFFSECFQPCAYPRYVFQRKYLHSVPQGAVAWQNGTGSLTEGFLGSRMHSYPYVKKTIQRPTTNDDLTEFEIHLSMNAAPFVFEHKYGNTILAPGGIYPEIALEAFSLYDNSAIDKIVLSFQFHAPLIPSKTDDSSHRLTIFPSDDKPEIYEFDVTSEGILHATGQALILSNKYSEKLHFNIKQLMDRCKDFVSIHQLRNKLESLGFTHGESLNWCSKRHIRRQRECFMELAVPSNVNLKETYLHPVFVDTFFQASSLLDARKDLIQHILPQRIDSIRIYRNQETAKWAYVKEIERFDDRQVFDGYLLNAEGEVVVKCIGLHWKPLNALATFKPADNLCYLSWKPEKVSKLTGKALSDKKILLIGDEYANINIKLEEYLGSKIHKLHQPLSVINGLPGSLNDNNLFPPDILSYNNILFTYCATTELPDMAKGNISKEIADVCFALLQLINFLQSRALNIPIHILVKDTYSLMQLEDLSEHYYMNACLGIAVAGMMRSVRLEFPQQCYRVIDIQDISFETTSLLKDIGEIEMPKLSTEIAIVKGSIMSLHVEHLLQRFDQKARFIEIEEMGKKSDVHLVYDNTQSLSWNLENHRLDRNTNKSQDKINDNKFHVIKLDKVLIKPVTNSTGPQTKHVMCEDAIATNQYQEKFVVCSNLPVSTAEIKVPKEWCIPVNLSPETLPCISFLWSAWNIVRSLKSTKWFCIDTEYNNPNYVALALILELIHGPMIEKSKLAEIVLAYAEDIVDLESLYEDMTGCEHLFICVPSKSNYDLLQEDILYSKDSTKVACISLKIFDTTMSTIFFESFDKFRNWIESLEVGKLQSICDQIKQMMLSRDMLKSITTNNMNDLLDSTVYTYFDISRNGSKQILLNEDSLFRKDAAYAVVGGSKGLGWEIVQHMAKNGAGKIGIISRSGLSISMKKCVANIESEKNCKIIDLKADVTDHVSLRNAFEVLNCEARNIPIKGIFFGAVLLEDCTMLNMTLSKFTKVLHPKISGVCNIYKICKNLKLDYMVFHSSITSIVGNAGQTNYAAANAFLNGFAYLCRKFLGVGQSICWGSLDFGILQDNHVAKSYLSEKGFQNLSSSDTLQCLNHSLLCNNILVSYSKHDFPVTLKYMRNFSDAAKAMYKWFFINKGHYLKSTEKQNDVQEKDIKSHIIDILQSTVGSLANESVPASEKLNNLGVDSFEITAVYSRLMNSYGQLTSLQLRNLGNMTVDDIVAAFQSE